MSLLKDKIAIKKSLIKNTPNDMELGKAVREILDRLELDGKEISTK